MSDPEAQLQNLPKNEEVKSNTDNDSGQINVEYQGIAEATGEDNTEVTKEKEQGVGGQIVNVLRKMTNDFGGRLSRGNSQPDLTENNNENNNNLHTNNLTSRSDGVKSDHTTNTDLSSSNNNFMSTPHGTQQNPSNNLHQPNQTSNFGAKIAPQTPEKEATEGLYGERQNKNYYDSSNSTDNHNNPNNKSSNYDQNQYTVHYHEGRGNPLKLRKEEKLLEQKQCRFMSKTGQYLVKHVKHKNQKNQRLVSDFFTTFVDMKWRYTLASFAAFFLVSWIFFAAIYYAIESVHHSIRLKDYYDLVDNNLNDTDEAPTWGGHCIGETNAENKFTGMFLFSLETQTTIGYGFRGITAECPAAIIVLILQSVIGCLIDAFTAGYIIAKFSRPKKRAATLLFSRDAVICQRDGKLCLMIRVGNLRKSLLVEATIRMLYISEKKTVEGETIPLGGLGDDNGYYFIILLFLIFVKAIIYGSKNYDNDR